MLSTIQPSIDFAAEGLFWTKWGVIVGLTIGIATLGATLYMAIPIWLARKKDKLSEIEKAILHAAWRDNGSFGQRVMLFDGWRFDRPTDRFIALHLGAGFITDHGEIDHLLVLGLLQEGRPPCESVGLGKFEGLKPRWYFITPAGRQIGATFSSELVVRVLTEHGRVLWD